MTAEVAAAEKGLARFHELKRSSLLAGARADLVARLPRDETARVLEVGCGTGATGALALCRGRAGSYTGIEGMTSAAEEARCQLDEVLVGDVEHLQLPWQPCAFDALIMSHAVELLIDPWTVLRRLHAHLRPGAMVLASSTNAAHWRVVRSLIRGEFGHTARSMPDRSRMRWFTPETFASLFEQSGYTVLSIEPESPFSPRMQLVSQLTDGRWDHLFMSEICIEARRR